MTKSHPDYVCLFLDGPDHGRIIGGQEALDTLMLICQKPGLPELSPDLIDLDTIVGKGMRTVPYFRRVGMQQIGMNRTVQIYFKHGLPYISAVYKVESVDEDTVVFRYRPEESDSRMVSEIRISDEAGSAEGHS